MFGRARAQLEGLRRTEGANRRETMATLRISFLSAFALELLAPGTLIESARVKIREPAVVCVCAACNARTDVDQWTDACPRCESPDVTLEGGRELTLESIELEDNTP